MKKYEVNMKSFSRRRDKFEMKEIEDIQFHGITLEDMEWYQYKTKSDYLEACDHTFACNYVWKDKNGVEVAEIAGCAVARYGSERSLHCSFPLGGSKDEKIQAINILMEYSKQQGKELLFFPITSKQRQFLNQYFAGEFELRYYRDYSDYLYETDTLAYLKGKKLAGKRNFINRFQAHSDWSYESMNHSNMEECWALELEWLKSKETHWDDMMAAEKLALRTALDYFFELGLTGGVLRQQGQVVAFAIGEELNPDTMVVHFEKANAEVVGAFQMINQQFVLHACQDHAYVNREDDVGDLHLRKAKTSYSPYDLVKKYSAARNGYSYAVQADEPDIRRIWQEAFGDDAEYISYYMEHRFTEETMLCIRQQGTIVSFANLLPVRLNCGKEYMDAIYLYAVATDITDRGNGYVSRLIAHIQEEYHMPVIVVPAEETLIPFYRELGFCPFFEEQQSVYFVEEIKQVPEDDYEVCDMSYAGEYKLSRDKRMERAGYVMWDETAIQYAIQENALCGGFLIKTGDGDFILYRTYDIPVASCEPQLTKDTSECKQENRIVKIIESTAIGDDFLRALKWILLKEKSSKAVYHNRGGWISWGDKPVNENPKGYLNLILDD